MKTDKIIPLKIEFDSLIQKYTNLLKDMISSKKVLVIGGAGTIGSNYIKQLLNYFPSKITVVDTNENALTELTRDLRSSNLLDYNPVYKSYPVNLLSNTFDKIFFSDGWDIVANFSAHKHVRSEKDILSIEALVKNNVFGAIKLLDLCTQSPPNHFFSVSTDKATNPVNIMGASKSLMEKIILAKKNEFRVTTARFANVAFSNGSLLDGFINRIKKSQPLSCPSNIKRFFVSPKQSGQICLIATFLGKSGYIFFPKLDFNKDQIFFKDVAKKFLKNNGYKPLLVNSEREAKKFDINNNKNYYPLFLFKSDTSGEKEYEEFYASDENYDLDSYECIGYIKSSETDIGYSEIVEDFENIFKNPKANKSDIINIFKKYIPNFNYIDKGKNLDEKM